MTECTYTLPDDFFNFLANGFKTREEVAEQDAEIRRIRAILDKFNEEYGDDDDF